MGGTASRLYMCKSVVSAVFQPIVVPAICYLFFMHVVCSMCSWQINDDNDDEIPANQK